MKGYHSWDYRKQGKPRSKYQRKPHHKKKEKDLNKEAWRHHKKIRRDRSKPECGMSGMTAGVHAWFKTESNRRMRRGVSQDLYREDWENWQDHGLDYYLDPWGWD